MAGSPSIVVFDTERLHGLLQGVSRTFALSIPELPDPLRNWVGCAYLICRIADTVEDRPNTDEAERQELFDAVWSTLGPPVDLAGAAVLQQRFRRLFGGPTADGVGDACDQLMASCEQVFAWLAGFPGPVVAALRTCVRDMVTGLRQTPLAPPGANPRPLFQSFHQLERYCHYAAGVVGVMLNRLFAVYLRGQAEDLGRHAVHDAKRFGRGLQITNIVKDHPRDLLDGRCFLPVEAARRCGFDAADLLQPCLPRPVRALVASRAAAHLDRAIEYTLSFPAEAGGIRLFCIQPLMMAVMTLQKVVQDVDITPTDVPKISRVQVQEVMSESHRLAGDLTGLRAWYTLHREALGRLLGNGTT